MAPSMVNQRMPHHLDFVHNGWKTNANAWKALRWGIPTTMLLVLHNYYHRRQLVPSLLWSGTLGFCIIFLKIEFGRRESRKEFEETYLQMNKQTRGVIQVPMNDEQEIKIQKMLEEAEN